MDPCISSEAELAWMAFRFAFRSAEIAERAGHHRNSRCCAARSAVSRRSRLQALFAARTEKCTWRPTPWVASRCYGVQLTTDGRASHDVCCPKGRQHPGHGREEHEHRWFYAEIDFARRRENLDSQQDTVPSARQQSASIHYAARKRPVVLCIRLAEQGR